MKLFAILWLGWASLAIAGTPAEHRAWIEGGCKHLRPSLDRRVPIDTPLDRATRPIDVQHVELDFEFPDVTTNFVDARVETRLVLLADAPHVDFDLESDTTATLGLRVRGAWVDGAMAPFTHAADTVRVTLPTPMAAGDTTTIAIEYDGRPVEGRFPGYGLRATNFLDDDFQNDPERPVLQTLSQPVGARRWWPSHDHPADAATVRLTVTAPPGFELAAPGRRESVETLGDGRTRQTNFMPHPIPSYLVSLIVADFDRWTEPVNVTELLDGGATQPRTIDLVYYAPSSRRADAEYTWQNTAAMMERFEALWGPYPYADVKYGNAVFQGAVAMEHPTMSSIGDSPFTLSGSESSLYAGPVGELVNAHELAHQWFGDALRVDRWGDIWLNEGFARFAEVVWLEEFYGDDEARAYRDILRESRDNWTGTLRDPDGLFSTVTYNKGALVLHMLSQILGRDGLMTAMRNYATDPALRFASVTIEDFRAHCEVVAGEDLAWFFDPWFSRSELPRVAVQWTATAGGVEIEIAQDAGNVYELPLPLRLRRTDGTFVDETAWIGRGADTFRFEIANVVGLEVDADRDWLVEVDDVTQSSFRFGGIGPNPSRGETATSLRFEVTGTVDLSVAVFDVRGRRVRAWRVDDAGPGAVALAWDGRDDAGRAVASGVYTVRVQGNGRTITSKVARLR